MEGEAPRRDGGAGPSRWPGSFGRALARIASVAEAASRGRARQAIGVLVAPVVAAAAYVLAWETVFFLEASGRLELVGVVVASIALWLVFFPAIAWAFVMLAFLVGGRRWSSVAGAPVLYWGVGLVYVLGGPILEGFTFGGGGDALWTSLWWPMLFAWAELGCGLDLGLCPN